MAKRQAAVAKRQNVKKFPTKVQGSRSYISFYKPTWGEIRMAVDIVRDRTKDYITATSALTTGEPLTAGKEATEVENTLSSTLWDLACDKFHEWNWVDDDGVPLEALPQVNMDDLYGEEVQAVFNIVQELYMMSTADKDSEGN